MLRPHTRPPQNTTPAWIVCAWPPVTCPALQTPDLHFVHLGTRVLKAGDSDTPTTGQTLWGGPSGDGAAGVAWDWVQIQEGVVAMADPFGLVTNLQLVGAQGQVLTGFEATLRLNELVHALPWQSEVQRALARVEH
jgi:hypothetical protein